MKGGWRLEVGGWRFATRFAISLAALLVKVTATMLSGLTPDSINFIKRLVKVRVLPEPAPAAIKTGPVKCSAASFCLELRKSPD